MIWVCADCFSPFSNKILVFGAGIHKMLVRKANREDPDQTASSKGALAWYGKLTWESAHPWILIILCYNLNIYGAFEFLCNPIANI